MKTNSRLSRQLGQAFPVAIALFCILSVASFVLFNTGQTVTDKTRVVNTADSAAYSGLLWQARAMNFTAYTNRAMVANQVAMAQAVSLNSWAAYLSVSAGNLDTVLQNVPYIGVVTGMVSAIADGLDTLLTPISESMLKVVDTINTGLGTAQEAMYLATFAATPDVVSSVVQSNDIRKQGFEWDTRYSLLNTGLNMNSWKTLTEKFEKEHTAAMLERKQLVEHSADRFSLERKWKFFGYFIPITPINWVRLEKSGTTKLFNKNGEWEWHASDSLSLRERRYTWLGKKYTDLPIGGGSSVANTKDDWSSIAGDHDFFPDRHSIVKKRRRNIAESPIHIHDGRKLDGYSGLQAYRALSEMWRSSDVPPILKLSIEIKLNPNDITSADDIQLKTEFTNNIDTPGDVISSVSSAELFFERPCLNQSCNGTEEYADGYSPYWDVRLADTSNMSRLAAYTMHEGILSDKQNYKPSTLHKLQKYNGPLATPVDDYQEQVKGVKRVLFDMERRLLSLTTGSDEYRAYEQRLKEIKGNINLEVDSIVQDIVRKTVTEEDLVLALARAADFDFDSREYDVIRGVAGNLYKDLSDIKSQDALETKYKDIGNQSTDELSDEIVQALGEKLRDAVARISNQLAIQALDETSDFEVDLSDECSIYVAVNSLEIKVRELQTRMEQANRNIAADFHTALIDISAESTTKLSFLSQEREEIEQLLKGSIGADNPYVDSEILSDDEWRNALMLALDSRNAQIDGLSQDRLEELIVELQEITNWHTRAIPEFNEFEMSEPYYRQTVLDVIGDLDDWEVDENEELISNNLAFANTGQELATDRMQELTEKPDHC